MMNLQEPSKSSRRAASWALVFAFFLMACLLEPCTSHAVENRLTAQWSLAEHLFRTGEYFRAITEYKRFMFYFPEDSKSSIASFRIVEAYVLGHWWKEGLKSARDIVNTELNDEQRARLHLLSGVCEMNLGRPGDALKSFRKALDLSDDAQLRDKALHLIGEVHALLENWEEAAESLERIPPESSLSRDASNKAALIRSRTPFPEKPPWVAGILAALLPGAGHLYTGRRRDAALVFSVNAAFTGATIEAIQKGNHALAGGLAMLELLWYSGNIFSAVGSAHKYNLSLRRELLKQIHLPAERAWQPDFEPNGGWRRAP